MKKRISDCTAGFDIEKLAEEIQCEENSWSDNSSDEDLNDNKRVFKNVESKWGWKEELFLIESIERCGLFNWGKISHSLSHERNKEYTAEEVQDHFFKYYVHGTLGEVWNFQFIGEQVQIIDHTEFDQNDVSSTSKYLPAVHKDNCRSIKFFPHREEFDEYPHEDIETMVTTVDFSSFYMSNIRNFNIEQEVKDLQLAVVDSYCRKVAERVELYKFMKDFKLIEQFSINNGHRSTMLKNCELEKTFRRMQKCICLFDSPTEFLNFYFNCVKEKLLKLEIRRLIQCLVKKEKKERSSEMESLLKGRAPSFLNVDMLLSSDEGYVLFKAKRRKRRLQFTRRKGTR